MNASAIQVRHVETREELSACVALQRATWGAEFSDLVPESILKVSQRVGGVTAGAFDQSGALLGFVFGITGVERGRIVHWSDMLAVRPEARNAGLGRRLKDFQRDYVRSLGAEVIYWTYDPLIARNAHLNFNKLGARVAEYVENMYGITDSVLHGAVPTDRLIVAWPTSDDRRDANLADVERTLSTPECRRAPVVTSDWVASLAGLNDLPPCVRIEIPANAEAILTSAPHDARRWRERTRHAFQWSIAAGYEVSAFDAEAAPDCGYYLLTRTPRPSSTSAGP
jgi:predicted GNAT superfamily acetyltransferase